MNAADVGHAGVPRLERLALVVVRGGEALEPFGFRYGTASTLHGRVPPAASRKDRPAST